MEILYKTVDKYLKFDKQEKGGMETLYKTVDNYLKFHKQEKKADKRYSSIIL